MVEEWLSRLGVMTEPTKAGLLACPAVGDYHSVIIVPNSSETSHSFHEPVAVTSWLYHVSGGSGSESIAFLGHSSAA